MRLIDADVLKQHIDKLPALPDGNLAGNHSALKALINMQPTIEPSTNCSEIPNNSDTISREAVADAINGIECTRHTTWYEFYHKVMIAVEKLPPAEPKIIRCKNCKHWIPYDWMFREIWQSKNIADYPEDEIGCAWSEMAMKANDFCSRGEKREVTT